MTKPQIDLSTLTQEAEDAFWQVVVQHYPEATSGDLSPWTSFQFSQVAEQAIAEWIYANVPESRDPSGPKSKNPMVSPNG